MMCDMIFASETAKFGQPEIKLGLIPGMGGSQRLTKLVGKAKAMDLILTGRMMGAREAERAGLVARVIPDDKLMEETLAAAETIAAYSKRAALAAREAVDRALELSLREGLLFERRSYHALWATEDAKEGMRAFIEKREPNFKGR
jgi:enoyl-CoA hydratase